MVDEAGRLVGVITIDDIVDVCRKKRDDEIKALGGVRADEELSDTVFYTARSRFVWLFVNLITAFVASAVLGLFEDSSRRWWRWPCLRPSSPARAAMPRPRP